MRVNILEETWGTQLFLLDAAPDSENAVLARLAFKQSERPQAFAILRAEDPIAEIQKAIKERLDAPVWAKQETEQDLQRDHKWLWKMIG